MVLRCGRTFLSSLHIHLLPMRTPLVRPKLQASQCGGFSYASNTDTHRRSTILATQITFCYLVAEITLMTTTSGQGRPVVPKHVTTVKCAVRSVVAHFFYYLQSILQCVNAKVVVIIMYSIIK